MLKQLRKHTKIVIWGVVATFILWGGVSFGVSLKKNARFAGEVFGVDITFQEFNRFHKLTNLLTRQDVEAPSPTELRQQTWKSIIYSKEANRKKIKVSDAEVQKYITEIFAAQGVTDLSSEAYQSWLKRTVKLRAHEFEGLMRELLRIQKYMALMGEREIETPSYNEMLDNYIRTETKSKFQILKFSKTEEAQAFQSAFNDESLEAPTLSSSVKTKETDWLTRDTALAELQYPNEIIETAFGLSPKQISSPLELEGSYLVLHCLAKQIPEKSDFIAPVQAEYKKKMIENLRSLDYLKWNLELLTRAGLKDYQT